jgi:hypothetical protein
MTISGALLSPKRVNRRPLARSAVLAFVGAVLLFAQSGERVQAAVSQGELRFFKNYFLTGGNTAVGGVGLLGLGDATGFATGTIHMSGVPTDGEVVAAFLYWISMETTTAPASANGFFRGLPIQGKQIAPAGAPSCWGSGGGFGTTGGASSLRVYRADVLRQLPIVAGKILVNDADLAANGHQVSLADSGGGGTQSPSSSNQATHTEGASLVVVYRVPTAPLRAVVIYDGGLTENPDFPTMSLTLKGFYQATATPNAKLTHIVSDGDSSKRETLRVNDVVNPDPNPFRGAQGSAWDNPTYDVRNVSDTSGDSVTTAVVPSATAMDCLSWGAVLFSTNVLDSDGDGLLDIWEESAATLFDPNNQPLPNLSQMGADKNHKDLFVEFGHMFAVAGTTYGGVEKPAHTHQLSPAALKQMGDAFKNAPVHNPNAIDGIKVHFDLGDSYPAGAADEYIIHGAGLARGGDKPINEMDMVCTRGQADPPWVCQFGNFVNSDGVVVNAAHPGTVGWKTGFKFLRDQFLNSPPPLTADGDDPCDAPGNDGPGQPCERRFDRNRKDMFHYVLSVHALGLPRADCLNPDGTPNSTCEQTNPDFHVPRSNSGVDDFPGGDGMLSLGAFPDAAGLPVGTPFMQGATLMHELGHGFELTHAGTPVAQPVPPEPNCKPNYLSTMNYLFQLRGLFNDVQPGVPHMDYSNIVIPGITANGINELNLFDASWFSSTPSYHTGWYAPQGIGSPASKHCDGSPLLSTDPQMFRVDSTTVAGPYDWGQDGLISGTPPEDLNFDGVRAQLNPAPNDWATLRLNQVGSRRNVGGFFTDAAGKSSLGPLSLDVGRGDIGRGDIGRGDIGRGDIGRGDIGRGDIGRGDIGRGDIGVGGLGRGDIGRGDIGRGDDEVTTEIAAASGNTPPNELRASVRGIEDPLNCAGLSPADCHRIRLDWKAPNVGSVVRYHVRRINPDGTTKSVGSVDAQPGIVDYFLVDMEELQDGVRFIYYVLAQFEGLDKNGNPLTSGPSNFAPITAVNFAPVANNDTYSMTQGTTLTVPAKGVLTNDRDLDSVSVTAARVANSGPATGTLVLNPNGSFTFTPPVSFNGVVSFKYTANDPFRSSNQATVTITVIKKPVK